MSVCDILNGSFLFTAAEKLCGRSLAAAKRNERPSFVCVCVCVCERVRESERERERVSVCMCACVFLHVPL